MAPQALANEKPKAEGGEQGKKEGGEKPQTAKRSSGYVHNWTQFPTLKLQRLSDKTPLVIEPQQDTILSVVFLASWCLPCQKYARILQTIANKFGDRKVRTVYVFTYDTQSDAKAFAAQYGFAESDIYIATHEVLTAFNQPELPSIYASDRRTWLTFMTSRTDDKLYKDYEQYLNFNTAL
jgi:thiol-disulfide isomerase/thioredoxin